MTKRGTSNMDEETKDELDKLAGPVADWTNLTRFLLDSSLLANANAEGEPVLLKGTPRGYLEAILEELADLWTRFDAELTRRGVSDGDEMSEQDTKIYNGIKERRQTMRRAAAARLVAWSEGINPDEDSESPLPTGQYV